MCCFCTCFAWSFDFIQRIITFLVTCCLCAAVCFGLILAIVTGIAYGYNYSMAEFIEFPTVQQKDSDVTVYMRRGQFYDRPDIRDSFKRSDYDPGDVDTYPDEPGQDEPLSDSWVKTQDARKYARKLTKFNPSYKRGALPAESQINPGVDQSTTIQSRLISMQPNPLTVETTLWQSGSSQIVMRNFEPTEDVGIDENKMKSDSKLLDDSHKSYVPTRIWATTTHERPTLPEYSPDEPDDDNIIYKPV